MDTENINKLRNFIGQQLEAGVSEQQVREALKSEGGWSDTDLNEVFSGMQSAPKAEEIQQIPPSPPSPPSPVSRPLPPAPPQETVEPENPAPESQTAQATGNVAPSVDAGTAADFGMNAQSAAPDPHEGGKRLGKIVTFVSIIVIVLVIGAGVAYMYTQGILFSKAPYSEDELFSGILSAMLDFDSVTYSASASLEVQDREDDAEPISSGLDEEAIEMRKRDIERVDEVNQIVNSLKWQAEFGQLEGDLEAEFGGFIGVDELSDPLTNELYAYTTSENNDDFELVVTFETNEAIKEVEYGARYDRATEINGKTVTFTKNSARVMRPEPSFNESLVEMLEGMPKDISGSLTYEVKTDLGNDSEVGDWDISFDADTNMQAMSFKVGADAKRKEDDYYFRLRYFPDIIPLPINMYKEEWIHLNLNEIDKEDPYVSQMVMDLPEMERTFKEIRSEFSEAYRLAIRIADEENFIELKGKPTSVKENEERVYLYDIGLKKEGLVSFLKELSDELEGDGYFEDSGMKEELESEEFDEMFEFIQSNFVFHIYVNKKGQPVRIHYGLRFVPPESARQFKEKQLYLSADMRFTDINEEVVVEVPEDTIPADEVFIEMMGGSMTTMRSDPTGLSYQRQRAQVATFKQAVVSRIPEFILMCDDGDLDNYVPANTDYVIWNPPTATSCGPSGAGTFTVTAVPANLQIDCEATVTEMGAEFFGSDC